MNWNRRNALTAGLAAGATWPGQAAQSWVTPPVKAEGVARIVFRSRTVGAEVSFHLCFPPGLMAQPTRSFPVLYWLHGTGGGRDGVAPLSAAFRRAMSAGRCPQMIVVFPNGLAESLWMDAADGSAPVETVLIEEILPQVDRDHPTIADRGARLIEGFSMGGYGAARLAFKWPALFAGSSFLAAGPLDQDFSGARARADSALRERILRRVFGGDLERYRSESPLAYARRYARRPTPTLRLRSAVGDRDFTVGDNRVFIDDLKTLGLQPDWTVAAGVGHSALALIDALGDGFWRFHRDALSNPSQ